MVDDIIEEELFDYEEEEFKLNSPPQKIKINYINFLLSIYKY